MSEVLLYLEEVTSKNYVFRSTKVYQPESGWKNKDIEEEYSYLIKRHHIKQNVTTDTQTEDLNLVFKFEVNIQDEDLKTGDYVFAESIPLIVEESKIEELSDKTLQVTFYNSFKKLRKAKLCSDEELRDIYKLYLSQEVNAKNYLVNDIVINTTNDIKNEVIVHQVRHGNYIEINNSEYTFAIDCGGNFRRSFRKHINYFILTHWHLDHFGLLYELRDYPNTRKEYIRKIILPELRVVCIDESLVFIKRDHDLLQNLILHYKSNVLIMKHRNIDNKNINYTKALFINHDRYQYRIYKSSSTNIDNNDGNVVQVRNSENREQLLLPGDANYEHLPQNLFNCDYLIASHHLGEVGNLKKVNFTNLAEVYVSRNYKYSENKKHFDFFNNDKSIKKFSTCHKRNESCKMKVSKNSFIGIKEYEFNFYF